MTVTLDLVPEIERNLLAQANERGVSLHDYLQEIVAKAAASSPDSQSPRKAANLSDLLLNSPFAGAGLDLERSKDFPRTSELASSVEKEIPGPPFKTGWGILAKYGPAPSAEEIDANRTEMFPHFAEDE